MADSGIYPCFGGKFDIDVLKQCIPEPWKHLRTKKQFLRDAKQCYREAWKEAKKQKKGTAIPHEKQVRAGKFTLTIQVTKPEPRSWNMWWTYRWKPLFTVAFLINILALAFSIAGCVSDKWGKIGSVTVAGATLIDFVCLALAQMFKSPVASYELVIPK
ncbi:hypothetical protein KFL_005800020 [Klebsormidium nitens]|uniref:Uncharacterized protein n=1 Tax=Klebsormidium nitens TaxID=105231 RepID=A0A1Y1IH21_KLENI|nr:hypothetical protein KFL_005800020 [Klebsormidium nitens]|eukprot:GAQ89943.1 hypothetical protein KFL_005800020 [Klebsormidium nitens]